MLGLPLIRPYSEFTIQFPFNIPHQHNLATNQRTTLTQLDVASVYYLQTVDDIRLHTPSILRESIPSFSVLLAQYHGKHGREHRQPTSSSHETYQPPAEPSIRLSGVQPTTTRRPRPLLAYLAFIPILPTLPLHLLPTPRNPSIPTSQVPAHRPHFRLLPTHILSNQMHGPRQIRHALTRGAQPTRHSPAHHTFTNQMRPHPAMARRPKLQCPHYGVRYHDGDMAELACGDLGS